MTLGAVSGGVLMQIGRRKSLFIICCIGITGNLITINIKSFAMLCIGRLFYGYAAGLFSSTIPKFMEETVPSHLFETVIASYLACQNLGNLIGTLESFFVPKDDDIEGLMNTNNWLIFYVYFPVSVLLLIMFLLLTIVRYESIKFLIVNNRLDEANKAVQQMYKYATNDKIADVYIAKIRSVSGAGSSGLTLKDALFNPQYRTATWVSIGYIIFHELTGVNVINMYSHNIFESMSGSGGLTVT